MGTRIETPEQAPAPISLRRHCDRMGTLEPGGARWDGTRPTQVVKEREPWR